MRNIAIIGAGQLGSRHLQALALHKKEIAIYLVDPAQTSLEISEKRFKEVDSFYNKQLYLKSQIEDLPKIIDFAVIATNSLQRLKVLKELLNHSKVKYLLLEKFLFPKEAEYPVAVDLIENKKVIAYVNCARRMWPSYREIKRKVLNDKNIKLTVSGSNWNLASNSIHFLDLFSYLCGDEKIIIDSSLLDQQLQENKRAGYIEFSGTLKGKANEGHSFVLTSEIDSKNPIKITIESNNQLYRIDELEEKISLNEGESQDFKLYHQSELTHKVYEQLLETGTCHLVPFKQSVDQHLILLKSFNKFLNGREGMIT